MNVSVNLDHYSVGRIAARSAVTALEGRRWTLSQDGGETARVEAGNQQQVGVHEQIGVSLVERISKTAHIHKLSDSPLEHGDVAQERLLGELRTIRKRIARLPELDKRSDDAILGYDEDGIPS